jgi:dissimilatory sulfite reductase (desulfoviridin) alpha/beta subunit
MSKDEPDSKEPLEQPGPQGPDSGGENVRPLWPNMLTAAARDINPWLRGCHGGELISKLSALHPGAARTSACELTIEADGWLSADSLFLLAETAESHRAQLVEFSSPDQTVRLAGLRSDGREIPFRSLRKLGLHTAGELSPPGRCPFWGPCLGRRGYLSEALAELAVELAPEITDDFKIEIAGCPIDCRHSAARADLALILDASASWFMVWLGGRHRPFTEPLLPRPWIRQGLEHIRELLDLVFGVHDRWLQLAAGSETLPELVARVGIDRFEMYMAEPTLMEESEGSRSLPQGGRS